MSRQAVLDRGRTDPAWFVRNVLRQDATSYQEAILQSLSRNRHTRVKSAHAIGKTALAGMAVVWFLPTHAPSQVISTAPTDRQIKDQLWAEVNKLYASAAVKLGSRPPDTQQWIVDPEAKWFGKGFTSPPNKPTSFQGYHSPNMLVVVDEACGVSKQIYDEGVSACMTGEARLLSIGNPTDGNSEFAKAFADPAPGAFTISAFDTPNFTYFGITIEDIRSGEWVDKVADRPLPRPYLTTPEWVAERYTRWGEESPLWLGRVMAIFPGSGDGALAEIAWLERASASFRAGVWPEGRGGILGVDVARTGNDSTKIYHRKGPWCRRLLEVHGADTMVVVGHVIQMQRETGATQVNIDEIGIGAGVVDRLHEQGYLWAVGVNNGGKADDEERFKNIRAESYWLTREALERGELYVQEEEFQTEITSIKWKPTSSGQIQIEAKEEARRRLGRSPDDSDAVALTFAKARRIVII